MSSSDTTDSSSPVKSCTNPFGDDRERSTLRTVLSGLGLEENEIQIFENENIGIDTFISLTDEDLVQMGITDLEKRKSILKIVCNLKLGGRKKDVTIQRLNPLSWKETSTMIMENSKRMDMLYKMLLFMKQQQCGRKVKLSFMDGFLDKKWSCSKALMACVTAAESQSDCVCKELENLLERVSGDKVVCKSKKNGKTFKIILASIGAIAGIALCARFLT